MKVLAIANQKGGVGKSTLASHFVWYALEAGRRVLLVDFDGQANTTRTFVDSDGAAGLTASQLFTVSPGELTERPVEISDRLSIIPADLDVNDVEGLDLDKILRPRQYLRNLDYPSDTICVIDTPPALGRRLLAALVAADAVVSPIALSSYSLQGITDLQKTIASVMAQFNPRLRNLGLVANIVKSRSSTHASMLRELQEELGNLLFADAIGDRVAISDAIDRKKPVWKSHRGGSAIDGGREMKSVCKAILEGLE